MHFIYLPSKMYKWIKLKILRYTSIHLLDKIKLQHRNKCFNPSDIQHIQCKNFTIPCNTHAYYTRVIIPLQTSLKIYVYSIIPSNIFIIHSDSKTVLKLHVIQRKVHHFHHKRQKQHMFQISLFIFESKIRKEQPKSTLLSFTEHFTSYPDYYIYEHKKKRRKWGKTLIEDKNNNLITWP